MSTKQVFPLSVCTPSVFVTPFRYFKSECDAEKKQRLSTQRIYMRSSFSFWYMWFLFLTFFVEKDLLILLEIAKYFEILSKFRNIEQQAGAELCQAQSSLELNLAS